ncbi:MAG: Phosphatidylserine decarboxylase-related protein [Acidobacteriales bacterium]|nr:Phosphatidylserine decarboxylase-related protein [Terriglobales bacterium]
MVKDGIYYGLGMFVAAVVLGYFTVPLLAIVPLLLGAFFLWFFRDPERAIPSEPGLVISPADGKVTSVLQTQVDGQPRTKISIFLNVFNVHVNRSPIAGKITQVQYQKGKFGNAMGAGSSDDNEQNIVTVQGEGQTVTFKQIAGLLARRIVFTKSVGDAVGRGERIGLIKFGSRVDVVLHPDVRVLVKVGDHVAGGSSVLAQQGTAGNRENVASDRVTTGAGV